MHNGENPDGEGIEAPLIEVLGGWQGQDSSYL